MKLRQTKSGQAAKNMKPPKFFKELTFLVPYLFEDEDRISNIPESENTKNSENEVCGATEENSHDSFPEAPSPNINDFEIRKPTPTVTSNRKIQKRAPSRESTSTNSVASVFENYLNKKQKISPVEEDPLITFFVSMAQTVKRFPLTDQIEIKRNLFKNINDVEMRIASANNNSVHTARQYYNNIDSVISPNYQQQEDIQQESTYYRL